MGTTLLCKQCLRPLPVNDNGELLLKGEFCLECLREQNRPSEKIDWDARKKIFEEKIEAIRGKKDFDGLVMLSGGKDSIYVCYLLAKIYKLNILAVTIDNGFEERHTFENSSSFAESLGISHFIYRLPLEDMKAYYRFLLTEKSIQREDCSQVCFFCGRLLKGLSMKLAQNLNVAAVFSGHTNEQVRSFGEEDTYRKDEQMRKKFTQSFTKKEYKKVEDLFNQDNRLGLRKYFEKNLEYNSVDNFIYPLQYFEYKPMEIVKLLEEEIGWKADTSYSTKYVSSGCKLAVIAEYVAHKNGKETYVEREFNDQVRRGSMTKEELMEVSSTRVNNDSELEALLNVLNIHKELL